MTDAYTFYALLFSAINIFYSLYLLYRIREKERESFEVFKDVEILKAVRKPLEVFKDVKRSFNDR